MSFYLLLINQPLFRMPFWWLAQEITRHPICPDPKKPALWKGEVDCDCRLGAFQWFISVICQLFIWCPLVTPWWLTCLGDSLSCGDSSDVLLASASQSVLPAIALQDFICAHLWPHAFSGDKRTDADQATAVEWIVYDQRNEKRVCMNATSSQDIVSGNILLGIFLPKFRTWCP